MKNERKAGFHVSIAGGVSKAFPHAIERNINAFQILLKSSNRLFLAHAHVKPVSIIMETPAGDDLLESDLANLEIFKKLIHG